MSGQSVLFVTEVIHKRLNNNINDNNDKMITMIIMAIMITIIMIKIER